MTASNSHFRGMKSELEAQFGPSEAIGPCALAFALENDGDGVVYTRTARADDAGPLINQAHRCIESAERAGRRPRRLLVSVCSGIAPLPEGLGRQARNPGLKALLDDAASPWCSWVAYQRTDRISRDPAVVEAVSRLRSLDVEMLEVDGYRFVGAAHQPVIDEQAVQEALVETIRTAVAEYETGYMKERIKAGLRARRDRDRANSAREELT